MDSRPHGAKRCLDCGKLKPRSEFWRWKQSRDGYAPYCKVCFGLRNADSYRGRRAVEGKKTRPYRRRSDVPEGMKYCPNCKETKPKSAFGSNRTNTGGLAAYCRPCHNSVMADVKARKHGSERSYLLKLRYGITEEQVEELRRRQGGICVICLQKPAAHVDHDHSTGKVRGLLCFGCNGGLGQFGDDPWRMRRAANYLGGIFVAYPDVHRSGREEAQPAVVRSPAKLWQRYRIRVEDFEQKVTLQRGRCLLCRDRPAEHVDHDHRTGAVRAILCPSCNTGMGQLRDDPVVLSRAADYVEGRLIRTVGGAEGERLSFTVPDVDPGTVGVADWRQHREADGRGRREKLRTVLVFRVYRGFTFSYERVLPPTTDVCSR